MADGVCVLLLSRQLKRDLIFHVRIIGAHSGAGLHVILPPGFVFNTAEPCTHCILEHTKGAVHMQYAALVSEETQSHRVEK